MPLFKKRKERKENAEGQDDTGNSKANDRKAEREDKVAKRRQWRIDKINAMKEKIYAVASKRKWLVFMIGAAIAAYLIIFKGGFSFGGDASGILETIKSFF